MLHALWKYRSCEDFWKVKNAVIEKDDIIDIFARFKHIKDLIMFKK